MGAREVKRGKVSRDTGTTLVLSAALVLIGIVFTLTPLNCEPRSLVEYIIRVLGVLALIVGSGCFTHYFSVARREIRSPA